MKDFRAAARTLNLLAREAARGEEFIIRNTADDLEATALKFSSGTVDRNALARMDHPYAKQRGIPYQRARRGLQGATLNPAIINEQTGDFKRGWRMQVKRTAAGWSAAVWNEDPKAVFLQSGTNLMFARPLDQQVIAAVRPRWEARWRFLFARLRSL